jgi:hypothetical protein
MSWLMSVKIAVLAPMPRASESTATVRKTGDLRSERKEYRKSRSIAAIDGYTAQHRKGYEIPPRIRTPMSWTPSAPRRGSADVARQIDGKADIGDVFKAVLHRFGEDSTNPDGESMH